MHRKKHIVSWGPGLVRVPEGSVVESLAGAGLELSWAGRERLLVHLPILPLVRVCRVHVWLPQTFNELDDSEKTGRTTVIEF